MFTSKIIVKIEIWIEEWNFSSQTLPPFYRFAVHLLVPSQTRSKSALKKTNRIVSEAAER